MSQAYEKISVEIEAHQRPCIDYRHCVKLTIELNDDASVLIDNEHKNSPKILFWISFLRPLFLLLSNRYNGLLHGHLKFHNP